MSSCSSTYRVTLLLEGVVEVPCDMGAEAIQESFLIGVKMANGNAQDFEFGIIDIKKAEMARVFRKEDLNLN